jgi:hypothetical protein
MSIHQLQLGMAHTLVPSQISKKEKVSIKNEAVHSFQSGAGF